MSAAFAIPERLEVVSGILNDTGGRRTHWKVIGMIYLLCLVSQVFRGPLPKSVLFVEVELYEELDCARQVSLQLGKENHMMASSRRFSSSSKHISCPMSSPFDIRYDIILTACHPTCPKHRFELLSGR